MFVFWFVVFATNPLWLNKVRENGQTVCGMRLFSQNLVQIMHKQYKWKLNKSHHSLLWNDKVNKCVKRSLCTNGRKQSARSEKKRITATKLTKWKAQQHRKKRRKYHSIAMHKEIDTHRNESNLMGMMLAGICGGLFYISISFWLLVLSLFALLSRTHKGQKARPYFINMYILNVFAFRRCACEYIYFS